MQSSGRVVRAVILEMCISLSTQLLGNRIPVAENTKSEEQYVEYRVQYHALQQDF